MSIKKAIGRLIPYPLIELGRKVLHLGPHTCPVCRAKVRSYSDVGYGFPVLERLQVVGGYRIAADQCPVCHSSSRERLVWYWLSQAGQGFRFENDITIAHFAPEKGLTKRLQAAAPKGYSAYDYSPERYRHLSGVQRADLSGLPIESNSIDLLICNHVLEHVPDVTVALAEILRVLKPEGTAILQVPLALNLESTIELGAKSTPEQRIAAVGQDDHLRLFTPDDYHATLAKAGFSVERFDAFAHNNRLATEWQLDPLERLHLCRKPTVGEHD